MDRITQQAHRPDGPRLQGRRRPVVEIPLLYFIFPRRVENSVDVRRPALKRLLEERDRAVGLLFRLRAPGIPREKRVVLVAALADVLRVWIVGFSVSLDAWSTRRWRAGGAVSRSQRQVFFSTRRGDGSGVAYSGYTVFAGELAYDSPDNGEVGYKVYIGPNQYFVITV